MAGQSLLDHFSSISRCNIEHKLLLPHEKFLRGLSILAKNELQCPIQGSISTLYINQNASNMETKLKFQGKFNIFPLHSIQSIAFIVEFFISRFVLIIPSATFIGSFACPFNLKLILIKMI